MRLSIRTPTGVFAEVSGVKRLVVRTPGGSFGLLPRRRDAVLPLEAGLLVYETDQEHVVAVDEGLLVKTGPDVSVSVHRAIAADLPDLPEAVERELCAQRARDQRAREVVARLESQFIRRWVEVSRGP
jgi:F-type H+-transporting ATPase subunit epsilon